MERAEFRAAVFERDNHKCVACEAPAKDAHHLLERRLWPDGGYYIDNGVSLCGECHLAAEATVLSVEELKICAGVNKKVIPPHMYTDVIYDKWGNVILANGQRTKGELFHDESVQKVLAPVLHLFTDRVKYPRTYHLPWSQNITDDDRVVDSVDIFEGKQVVITEKMDGENTTMYRDHIHARSVDSSTHPSRSWVKQLWGSIRHEIPEGWRICGENLYAKHSIGYDNLPSYFMVFSIWNSNNVCLSWYETGVWCQLLGLESVPLLYGGVYDPAIIQRLNTLLENQWASKEGYVVRLEAEFTYRNFRNAVAKYVRANHIQTVKHWMHGQAIEPNGLAATDKADL